MTTNALLSPESVSAISALSRRTRVELLAALTRTDLADLGYPAFDEDESASDHFDICLGTEIESFFEKRIPYWPSKDPNADWSAGFALEQSEELEAILVGELEDSGSSADAGIVELVGKLRLYAKTFAPEVALDLVAIAKRAGRGHRFFLWDVRVGPLKYPAVQRILSELG